VKISERLEQKESCALVVLLQSGFSNGGYGVARAFTPTLLCKILEPI
jgi:hypothetical protein